MNDSEHVDLSRLDIVENAVRPFDDLSNLGHLIFRDHAPGERKFRDLLGSPRQALHHSPGVRGRILGDLAVDRVQVPQRRIGPMNVHSGKPYLRRTSWTSVVLPALLSDRSVVDMNRNHSTPVS